MTTITLVQNARADVANILGMTAMPMGVQLQNVAGGPAQFRCTNAQAAIQGARSVDITYDATVRGAPTESIQVSSVIA